MIATSAAGCPHRRNQSAPIPPVEAPAALLHAQAAVFKAVMLNNYRTKQCFLSYNWAKEYRS